MNSVCIVCAASNTFGVDCAFGVFTFVFHTPRNPKNKGRSHRSCNICAVTLEVLHFYLYTILYNEALPYAYRAPSPLLFLGHLAS